MSERPESLYEAVGGMDALRRLSNAFYDNVPADPLLASVFADFTPTHIEHVAVRPAEIFDGPADSTAQHGGHQALLRVHLGLSMLSVTEQQRLRRS
ncbi:hypothetical protein [Streptomyces sp. NPDC088246]|uniref:globin domain-containing protein n=1 Tax=Streptomyces sp. NPDC088246 TaxID=3365842 RepID=UPI00382CA88D